MSTWYVNKENIVSINLGSHYTYNKASGFSLYYRYSTDDTLTKADVSFIEEKESISDPVTVNVVGDTKSGSTTIKVSDVSNIDKSMRFRVKDKDIFFCVDSVDTSNNTITLKNKLCCDIADNAELDQVGNVGTYSTTLKFSSPGSIILMVRHIDLDIDFEPTVIEVVDEINNIKNDLKLLKTLETCKMEIKDNKLYYYDENDNEIVVFDLYDRNGKGTDSDVYKRVPE